MWNSPPALDFTGRSVERRNIGKIKRLGYTYNQSQTLQMLEELKNTDPEIHRVVEDDFIFKTGYYPWWSQSYVGDAMTFTLCAVTGSIALL